MNHAPTTTTDDGLCVELNRTERNLLLYLETRAVDHGGLVDPRRMNEDDHAIAKRWNAEGFVAFERLKFKDGGPVGECTHACALSEAAWDAAHVCRKSRGIQGALDRAPDMPTYTLAARKGGAQ